MPYETGLISFAAFTCLALAMKKHRSGLEPLVLPSQGVLRVLGWGLLALSAAVAVARMGPALGVTAWIGQMCAAAALLVLLLSWRPKAATALAGVGLICAPFLAFL
ncbi:DUF3325 domain-containing protein [Caulobacter flavus]|uniref:DUF3325 domain-containing protein n=1 Tax=Caulobacter flavus TaxID=1679497 RepID=A0A2N5CLZ8_9CAUL|nr:DUF3325 domain-containing protein [Caulobacter flavus]AYV48135.1 DUF3325 domain-containing protein [Caulobacter flavus]PLR06940.1 DUF3325 domain-containing protein [Caulobacter flavus]